MEILGKGNGSRAYARARYNNPARHYRRVAVVSILALVAVSLLAGCQVGDSAPAAQQATTSWVAPAPGYWPTGGWRTSTPEQQGLDSDKLADTLGYVRQKEINLHSLLVVRNGYLVLDAYFYPFNQESVHDLASVTKSVTSLLVGVAIQEGKISSVHQPLLQLFGNSSAGGNTANNDLRKDKITIEHLLTMTSGLDCKKGADEQTLNEMRQSGDWVRFMLDRPMSAEPGTSFNYCSGGMHLLSGAVSRATGANELDLARRALFQPLGIRDAVWPSDPQGVSYGWGDLHLHPVDMAKIGYLYLNKGVWDGKRIVAESWVDASTAAHVATDEESDYGYGWWVKSHDEPFVFEARGRGGQRISVMPSKNIVVVMTGGGFEPGDVGALLGAALKSDAPLPENPDGVARLQATVDASAKPPAPLAIQPLPPLASAISGSTYRLGTNPLGLETLSLRFRTEGEALVTLGFKDNRSEERPVGLDGVARLSPGGKLGLDVGLKGHWESEQVFVFDYDEISNINSYRIGFNFDGAHAERLDVEVTERTSGSQVKFEGRSDGK